MGALSANSSIEVSSDLVPMWEQEAARRRPARVILAHRLLPFVRRLDARAPDLVIEVQTVAHPTLDEPSRQGRSFAGFPLLS
jgi:hypothetical protein